MLRIYNCLAEAHDRGLLLLAALVCLTGSAVAIGLLRRALQAAPRSRDGWLLLGGMAAGAAAWCTHFIAMMAYLPGQSLGFRPLPTLASLLIAVACAVGGFTLAARRPVAREPAPASSPSPPPAGGPAAEARPGWTRQLLPGGALLGGGITVMHYLGLTAFGQDGLVLFSWPYVAASAGLSIGLATLAMAGGLRPDRAVPAWLAGTLALTIGILSLHLTGMAAIEVLPVPLGHDGQDAAALALVIGAVGLMVAASAAAAHMIDRRTEEDGVLRLRRLADSALEGLAVVRDGCILEANASFQAMSGLPRESLIGLPLPGALLPQLGPGGSGAGGTSDEGPVLRETLLHRPDGRPLDVEVLVRDDVPQPGKQVFVLRDLRERRAQEQRIIHLALHDSLTGLANRTRFVQQLDAALRRAAGPAAPAPGLALLRIGLNGFKAVNDLYGHAAGDAVLRGYAQRLAALLPAGGVPARLGGDEFAVLLPFAEEADVTTLLGGIEALAEQPEQIGGASIAVTAAIGIALYPMDAANAEALMANADIALQRAKVVPGRATCFYQAGMDARVRERRRLAEDLRGAQSAGELMLFFQPQVLVATGQGFGHEVLMRWQHPAQGFVPPDRFIPLAEESGLILPLGEWALREACRAAMAEPRLGRVAVNISPVQFRHPDLPAMVASALAESGLPPGRLELEITESTLMGDSRRALDILRQITALGVGIAMDDFGTGYSSLGTLRSFPFDKIKLDRSFIREIGESAQALAILRAVLDMGQGLGVPVLAEGVETAEQLQRLRDEGCAQAQGYLFGRPAPLAALALPGQERVA
ncbi:bifunctional diguanylate cyclase/phosphodiesterase [Roseomonas sp. USHLN139]|uniref:bifunctional diguanylate cyclase/phosphodiesterase n=1 Tax=Roseomonas sp. USHLN139 TaxID=3081298 RepID=UPI003B02B65C